MGVRNITPPRGTWGRVSLTGQRSIPPAPNPHPTMISLSEVRFRETNAEMEICVQEVYRYRSSICKEGAKQHPAEGGVKLENK